MEESQYYILYNDGTKSMPHSLYELSRIENITKETLIIKNNGVPKPAAAFIDFTDNRQTRLPYELNTLNIGAFILAPIWGYNNLPKYKIYWGIYIVIILLSYLFSSYLYLSDGKNTELFGMSTLLTNLMIILHFPIKVISILYLIDGNEMAWKNRKFKNIEQFRDIQKKWFIWGCIIYLLFFILSFFTPIRQIIPYISYI